MMVVFLVRCVVCGVRVVCGLLCIVVCAWCYLVFNINMWAKLAFIHVLIRANIRLLRVLWWYGNVSRKVV